MNYTLPITHIGGPLDKTTLEEFYPWSISKVIEETKVMGKHLYTVRHLYSLKNDSCESKFHYKYDGFEEISSGDDQESFTELVLC